MGADKCAGTQSMPAPGPFACTAALPRLVSLHPAVPAVPAASAAQVAVERYIYFPSSRAALGLRGPSLLDIQRQGLR